MEVLYMIETRVVSRVKMCACNQFHSTAEKHTFISGAHWTRPHSVSTARCWAFWPQQEGPTWPWEEAWQDLRGWLSQWGKVTILPKMWSCDDKENEEDPARVSSLLSGQSPLSSAPKWTHTAWHWADLQNICWINKCLHTADLVSEICLLEKSETWRRNSIRWTHLKSTRFTCGLHMPPLPLSSPARGFYWIWFPFPPYLRPTSLIPSNVDLFQE